MISTAQPHFRCLVLTLIFALASVAAGFAREAGPALGAEQTSRPAAAVRLANEVRAIAGSATISRAKKEKQISTAVRIAVVAGTAYQKDPAEIPGIAMELAEAAAKAAPHFAEVIANAVSFAPSVSRVDTAPGQIRAAAYAAAKNPRSIAKGPIAATGKTAPASRTGRMNDIPVDEPGPGFARTRQEPESAGTSEGADFGDPGLPPFSTAPKIPLGDNASADLMMRLAVRHDDNVYLTGTDKTGDTIFALTPGVEFRFGQNSLAHGSVNYNESFTRYANRSAPNVTLGDGKADFGYDNGRLAIAGTAAFQQLNQNTDAVAGIGAKAIYRRDVLSVYTSAETHLTAKTSVMAGANYNRTEYKTAGLVGSEDLGWPLRFYYESTPKVSLSAGFDYRKVKPQDSGPEGRDLYYNIGARGSFTPKLTGEISAGYRTREVGTSPAENLWGFNGTFSYEVTPKTNAALVLSRDFSVGALGESLQNSAYALKLSADPTPQWQLGAGLTYRSVDYGAKVFNPNNPTSPTSRQDGYWEGTLLATYLYSSSLSATADYTLRNNHSTVPGLTFSNNVLSLMLGWRY